MKMETQHPIIVHVNGQAKETAKDVSIPEFLSSLNLDSSKVVVEYNGSAQTRDETANTHLKDGDRLEVVRIVAGG
jgi:sulfur carrier protein